MKLRVASRESRLAVIQSQQVMETLARLHPELELELVTMKTTGDRILDRTLDQIGGKGLFVRELDEALRSGRAELSVHSCKDLPMEEPADLPLLAFSCREDPRDALVLPQGVQTLDLTRPVGCASLRRTLQFQVLYPDARVEPVRGNVLQTQAAQAGRGTVFRPDPGGGRIAAAGTGGANLSDLYAGGDAARRRSGNPGGTRPGGSGSGLPGRLGGPGQPGLRLGGTGLRPNAGRRLFLSGGSICHHGRRDVDTAWTLCDAGGPDGAGNRLRSAHPGAGFGSRIGPKIKGGAGMSGKVTLVGAGPGDPGLLTLKGRTALEEAEVVVV